MLVDELADEIQQVLELRKLAHPPNRFLLIRWMSNELTEITGKGDWNWAKQHINPTVATQTGIRSYPLPDNFPDNFCRSAGELGDGFACMLDDLTNESQLTYIAPELYVTRNLRGTANGRPGEYTVMGSSRGGREIFLYPPPDSNSSTYYTVDGVYIPTDWKLKDKDQLPVVPGNSTILKFGVLRRLFPEYEAQYQEALGFLRYQAAKDSKAQLRPAISYSTSYSLMR